jgi:hypothetical protein
VTAPLVTPPIAKLVLTREAAKILECSMRQVRALAVAGKIKSWPLGPKSFAYDLEELQNRKSTLAAGRKAGTIRGALPQGFKADIAPQDRIKKKAKKK